MLEISDKTFFYFVLPPIIFAQGYGLKKRNFFKYFHFITVFGILGTFLQFAFMTGSLYLLAGWLDVTVEREDGVSKVRVERGRQSTYELKLSLQPSISAMN